MKVKEIIKVMGLKMITKEIGLENQVEGGCCGDLLSFVMAHAKEKQVWITIQGHINSVAVASLAGVSLIVLAEGQDADEDMIKKAEEEEIPVVSTRLSSFDFIVEYTKLCLKE